MDLEHFQQLRPILYAQPSVEKVSSKEIRRAEQSVAAHRLQACVDSQATLNDAYAALAELDAIGMLSEHAADRLHILAMPHR